MCKPNRRSKRDDPEPLRLINLATPGVLVQFSDSEVMTRTLLMDYVRFLGNSVSRVDASLLPELFSFSPRPKPV